MKIITVCISAILIVSILPGILLYNWTTLAFIEKKIIKQTRANENLTKTKKPLVIFMVTNNYTPYSGGVVTAIDSYTQELRSQGHRVIIITLDFLGAAQKPEYDVMRIWCPLRFTYGNNYMALPYRPEQAIYRLAQQFKPDIIHTYHPFLLGACALRVAKSLAIPLVFTYMTLYEHYVHNIPLPEVITRPATRIVVKNFCSHVNALTAPSQSTKDALAAQGIKKIPTVIPLSILPLFVNAEFHPKIIAHKKRIQLISVSRFTKEKNIFFLLDVYKQLDSKKFKFALIGFGPYLKKLQAYAYKKLRLSPKDIQFIIKPTKEMLKNWYNKARFFIYASKTETQGLVLAEAMAQGTPVIALNGPGIIDCVQDGINGFLINNEREMVEKIKQGTQDIALYEKLNYQAWQTSENYTNHACVKKLVNLYNSLVII